MPMRNISTDANAVFVNTLDIISLVECTFCELPPRTYEYTLLSTSLYVEVGLKGGGKVRVNRPLDELLTDLRIDTFITEAQKSQVAAFELALDSWT